MGAGGQRPAQKRPGGGNELGSPRCPHQPCCLPELLPGCLPPLKPARVPASHPRLGALPPPLTAGVPAASPRAPSPEREETPRASGAPGNRPRGRSPPPAPPSALGRAPRGSQKARPREGAPPSPGSTAARRPGPQPPPVPTACRLAGCLAPRGSERPPRLGHAALCAWRVLPPRTSLPKRRGPASRQPGGRRRAPRPPPRAPRLPEGGPASARGPAAAVSRAGGARAVGGRGGRARGAARPEVAPPGDRCALGGLRPGLRSPRRCFSPFWPRAAGGAGRAALAPATPRGQASGERRRRARRARLRVACCGTAPVTAQTLRGPRGASAPPGSRLGPGSWEPKTAAHFRRQEQRSPLTCGQTRGSRGREGGAAHLGQVRGGDSPSDGGRCGPAQRPGEGGP